MIKKILLGFGIVLLMINSVDATVISNDATFKSCDTRCSDLGYLSCLDVGTDAAGTNNRQATDTGGGCVYQKTPATSCSTSMGDIGLSCFGRNAVWTNCLCEDPDVTTPIVTNISGTTTYSGSEGINLSFNATDEQELDTVLIYHTNDSGLTNYTITTNNIGDYYYNDTYIVNGVSGIVNEFWGFANDTGGNSNISSNEWEISWFASFPINSSLTLEDIVGIYNNPLYYINMSDETNNCLYQINFDLEIGENGALNMENCTLMVNSTDSSRAIGVYGNFTMNYSNITWAGQSMYIWTGYSPSDIFIENSYVHRMGNNQISYRSGLELLTNKVTLTNTSFQIVWGIRLWADNTRISNFSLLGGNCIGNGFRIRSNNVTIENVNVSDICSSQPWGLAEGLQVTGHNVTLINLTVNDVDIFGDATFIDSRFYDPDGKVNIGLKANFTFANTFSGIVNYTADNLSVSGANFSIYNGTNSIIHSSLTNATGYTPSILLIEYIQNETAFSYQSNYSMNLTLTGYKHTSKILSMNQTTLLEQFFMDLSSCTYVSGDWNIDCSEDCILETTEVDSGADIIFSNLGTKSLTNIITNWDKIIINNQCKLDDISNLFS